MALETRQILREDGIELAVLEIEDGVLKKCIEKSNAEYSILDKNSMDTVGDAVFSSLILKKISFFGKLKVISSDWHIERVKKIFERIYDSNFKIDFIASKELDYIKSNIKIKILRNERNAIEEFTNNFSGFNKERNSAFNYLIKNHKLYNGSFNKII